MKKTLFVMFDFPPRDGGAQRYDWDMVRALPREKVVVLAPRWANWREFDKGSGYKTYRIPWGWMEKLTLPILPFVASYVALRERVEGIWFSKYSRMIPFTTIITSKVLGLPYGLSVLGEDLAWAPEDFGVDLPAIAFRLRDSAIKNAECIVAISRFSGSLLPSARRFSVIYPCTPVNVRPERSVSVRTSGHLDSGPITFLSVGSLTKKKGFDLVISALAAGLPGGREFRYLIAGSGPEMESLKALARELGINDSVEFLGSVSDETKDVCYKRADVFVMPSRIEGFGIAFLEAAAHGLCIVGSRAGGIPEAVQDGIAGLLVESENVEELRDILALAARDRDLRLRMGEAARSRNQREFQWNRFAEEWASVFEVAGSDPERRPLVVNQQTQRT
jgi:phosphatidylinositol alpha-1,6-mannosyltransferase